MFVSIITDCQSGNDKNRLTARVAQLFDCPMSFVPIDSGVGASDVGAELALSGNIVDALDALGEASGVILGNVAPRSGVHDQFENGTPFGFFRYKNTLVVTTIAGFGLSLPIAMGLVEQVEYVNIPEITPLLAAAGLIKKTDQARIIDTQFRSFEFAPRLARLVLDGVQLPTHSLPVSEIATPIPSVWWVDSFGNCKTTLRETDLVIAEDGTVHTMFGKLPLVARLKDVPDGDPALVIGSSGIADQRFIEVVMQGDSAAEYFGITIGSEVL